MRGAAEAENRASHAAEATTDATAKFRTIDNTRMASTERSIDVSTQRLNSSRKRPALTSMPADTISSQLQFTRSFAAQPVVKRVDGENLIVCAQADCIGCS
jgi:hypothetical protein